MHPRPLLDCGKTHLSTLPGRNRRENKCLQHREREIEVLGYIDIHLYCVLFVYFLGASCFIPVERA